MAFIRLRHDEDDDASDGGHAKIDCHGGGDGNAHGDSGGYGDTMANLMVLAMAMSMMMMMMMMEVVINTRQRAQHCNPVRAGLRVETSMLVSWLKPTCWSHG